MSNHDGNGLGWPTPSQGSGYSEVDQAVKLARVEEGLRHVADKATVSAERIHILANRLQAMDSSNAMRDRDFREVAERVVLLAPIVEEFKRRADRGRFIRDVLNYVSVPLVLWLALSGKMAWGDVLRALGRIFAAG